MVLPDSDGIPRVPPYSGSTLERRKFGLQGCYLLWRAFPDRFVYSVPLSLRIECPTTPRGKPLGLGCSRFARRYSGNRICFLFLRVLRCFSSPGLPHATLCIHVTCPIPLRMVGSPIRKSSDQSILTAPRSISLFVASFIGS